MPQNAKAGASTFTTPFSCPRGCGSARGLGLTDEQVDDLADFIENALYDPAFVHFDPNSTTDTIKLNERDVTYSTYRPDLAALRAVDGRPASGRPPDNDDALSRRDMGLEFLDVTSQGNVALIDGGSASSRRGGPERRVYRLTSSGTSPIDTHRLAVAGGLSFQVEMTNASGRTSSGDPYVRVFLPGGVLAPGQSIEVTLDFRRHRQSPPVSFTLTLLSGQGTPQSRPVASTERPFPSGIPRGFAPARCVDNPREHNQLEHQQGRAIASRTFADKGARRI